MRWLASASYLTGRVKTPRTVALTFDDGPSPDVYAAGPLGLLRRDHVPATFFAHRRARPALPEPRARGDPIGHERWEPPWTTPKARPSSTWQLRACVRRSQRRTLSWLRLGDHAQLFRRRAAASTLSGRSHPGRGPARRAVGCRSLETGRQSDRERRSLERSWEGQARGGRRTARRRGRSVRNGRGTPEDHPRISQNGPAPLERIR